MKPEPSEFEKGVDPRNVDGYIAVIAIVAYILFACLIGD